MDLPEHPSLIDGGTIPASEDTDGNSTWNRTAANTTDAERTASQPPETDAHATVADLYDWYAAIGGRVGWDDGAYSAPLVPNETLNVVTHCYDGFAPAHRVRSTPSSTPASSAATGWRTWRSFDGDPSATERYDYLAGSKSIGHEYQHAITDFSFVDGMGNPRLTYSATTEWYAAVHEGLSGVFGGLYNYGRNVMGTSVHLREHHFPNV